MTTALILIYFALQLFLAVLFCFFGYRHIKKIIMAYGFLMGAGISYLLLWSAVSPVLAIVLPILIGIIVALLFYFFFFLGIFFTGANFGITAALFLLTLIKADPSSAFPMIFIALLAIAIGCMTVVYRRFFLILSTSFNGGFSLTLYGGFLIFQIAPLLSASSSFAQAFVKLNDSLQGFYAANGLLISGVAVALGIVGMIVQFTKTAPGKKSKKH